MNESVKSFILATGIIVTLSGSTILTPLWINGISGNNSTTKNNSNESFNRSEYSKAKINSFSIIFIVNAVYVVLSAIVLFIVIVFKPIKIGQKERKLPKLNHFYIGFADALSTIFLVYAASGKRTAPSLQSLTSNFSIPVTFFIRFVILRKKPTLRKGSFAVLVLLAEFIALIPSIFPSLEGTEAHISDGGAQGLAGVLWPLCYAFGFIPQAIVNVVIEKSAKPSPQSSERSAGQLILLMFWSYLFCFTALCSLFWTDFLIPGFGEVDNIYDFWEIFKFNILCFVGVESCDIQVHICSVVLIVDMFITRILVILFLKISEGSNYLVIIMSLQTPAVLLFWTLFIEDPFHLSPHQDLSTWLSIAAVGIMLPSIYFYSTSPQETITNEQTEEKRPLLAESQVSIIDHRPIFNKSSDSYQSIDIQGATDNEEEYPSSHHPHVQSFTDSYQSIRSLDSSVNSFRNSFVYRHNTL